MLMLQQTSLRYIRCVYDQQSPDTASQGSIAGHGVGASTWPKRWVSAAYRADHVVA